MSKRNLDIADAEKQPDYVGWRGELLAELALSRIPGLIVSRRPDRPDSGIGFDLLAATDGGFCFFVAVRAFSSATGRVKGHRRRDVWTWTLKPAEVRRARESRSPFLLFLFDADTDEGRFLRIDSLPEPDPETDRVRLDFPEQNTIDGKSLEGWIRTTQAGKARRPSPGEIPGLDRHR